MPKRTGKNITPQEVAVITQVVDTVLPKLQSGESLLTDDTFALDSFITLRNRLSKGPKLGKLSPAEVEKARTLYYLSSCSMARIAQNIGVSEMTVKNALNRKGPYSSTAYDPAS